VFVEHGGHGGVTAAPIAKHVLETFFAKQEGRPLPPAPVRDERPGAKDPPARSASTTAN
jgi:hypothetical protein